MDYIPIDFLKAQLIGIKRCKLESNPLLINPKSIYTGELLTKIIYRYKNLVIRIFTNNDRIELSGSLHTFFNDGKHNHNDFCCYAFKTSLNNLYVDLGIRPENLYLLHLEWGFNLDLLFKTNYVLDSLIQHCSVNKTVAIDSKLEGKYIQFKHSNYIFKIYNKAMHYKLDKEKIRLEIKQTNWSKYRLKGIRTLEDFIKSDKSIFMNELLYQWSRVILYDINNSLTDAYIKYETSSYWLNLRNEFSNKAFKYNLGKLKKLNKELGLNIQKKVEILLIKKGNELQL